MITHLLEPAVFEGDEAAVEGDAYRHLFRARRVALGERLRVVDGAGRARWAEVTMVDRQVGRLRLGAQAPSQEPAYQLELLVAPIRPERASWLVEKATELGVSAIRFLASERAPRRFGEGTFERLGRVARAAVEQCQRSAVPRITGIHAWQDLEHLMVGRGDRYFLDPESADGSFDQLRASGPDDEAARAASDRSRTNQLVGGALTGAVVIGPEGGFTADEQKTLARMATPISLGERILRAETAAVVAAGRVLC